LITDIIRIQRDIVYCRATSGSVGVTTLCRETRAVILLCYRVFCRIQRCIHSKSWQRIFHKLFLSRYVWSCVSGPRRRLQASIQTTMCTLGRCVWRTSSLCGQRRCGLSTLVESDSRSPALATSNHRPPHYLLNMRQPSIYLFHVTPPLFKTCKQ
jgi:hypothetical protein